MVEIAGSSSSPSRSDADEKGYARTHIVLSLTIHGAAKYALIEAGIWNPYSQQIPNFIRASPGRGRAGVVRKGLAWLPSVHTIDSKSV